ncbi:MAG: NUDIX domain-containing protein [Firmicutes bacterium]|nr:NUDIX domain-containing protein [Bacillota bacterium]
MELIDTYDKDGNHAGVMDKFVAIETLQRFKCVHVWIINSKGEVLVQKRSANKRSHPNEWDVSVGGFILAGEEILDACVREVFEELGINLTKEKFVFQCAIQKTKGLIPYLFLVKQDIEIKDMKLQTCEVSQVKWLSFKDFEKFFASREFVPHSEYYRSTVLGFIKRGVQGL